MRWIKRNLPKSLFGRGLLIVALPIMLVQLVTVYIFFDRHVDNVSKYMRQSYIGEITFLAELLRENVSIPEKEIARIFQSKTSVYTKFHAGKSLQDYPKSKQFGQFQKELKNKINEPFRVFLEGANLVVAIEFENGVLVLSTTSKRLESQTVDIFIFWSLGAAMVFLCIALLFLRNQVRPIKELAEAAEKFGKGQDTILFKPSGAVEVRRAGRAFLIMRERIARQIRTRTQMLDGISHDLRTPLTRMKLQLAMLPEAEENKNLHDDIEQMQAMINAYLEYTKENQGEEPVAITLTEIIASVVGDFNRQGDVVEVEELPEATLVLREYAMKRVFANLVTNAIRYGKNCRISAKIIANSKVEIYVDDEGSGIEEKMREEVFRPFTRLDEARNLNEGGVGLGLTISRDIVRSHGGDISLVENPHQGLRVVVKLPI